MEFVPRATKNLIGYLVSACLFFTGSAALRAQVLSPVNSAATVDSLSFSWTGSVQPYIMALSTRSDFSVLAATGSLSATATTYVNLQQNTLYFFKVKPASADDGQYEYIVPASTSTLAAAPDGINFNSVGFRTYTGLPLQAIISMGWNPNGNPDDTTYLVDYSIDPDSPSPATVGRAYASSVDIAPLSANTTYYFKVRAVNRSGVPTSPSAEASTATLALALSGIENTFDETSATVSWVAVNGALPREDSEGYRLDLSLSNNMTPLLPGWSAADHDISSTSLTGLDSNTTYYYRVGSLNWYGAMNWDKTRSFTTLSAQPQNLQFAGVGVGTQTATLGWTALPAGPSSATAAGYRLEASSTNFTDGVIHSSSTPTPLLSTLTVSGLDANTTYYFRVGSINQAFILNYSSRLSSITLSVPLSPDLLTATAGQLTITVNLASPLPAGPQSASCEGYLLEGSSQPFGSGSVTYSSVSYSNFTNSLTLENLRSNTIYYLRIATLNWTKTPNFSVLPETLTAIAGALVSVPIADIRQTSVAVSFASLASDGYVLEASTASYFNPIYRSSSTTDASASGLAVTGLDPNTPYYFRAGALYNGATVYTLAVPARRYTLPLPLTGQAITGVFYTSATVSWTALAASPSSATAVGYHLAASTSPDFSPPAYTAATNDLSAGGLTVTNLVPNTSYYFRAGTVNMDSAENYVYTPATSTLANPPVQTAFTGFATGQLTVNWLANSNPPDTVYFVRFSSYPGYDSFFSSGTLNTYAAFSGLAPNTTYYPEVTAINRLNVPEGPYDFSDMATLAFDPVPLAFSPPGVSSITLNWDRGENPPGETDYKAEISSSPAFAPPVLSSVTLATSSTFYGLVSNATYYLRVSALNRTGVGTALVPLDPVLTLPATAYVLSRADTFSDLMTDGFTLHWASNGNSTHTIYNVKISTAEDFNAGAAGGTAVVQGLSRAFKDLLLGATYWAQIQSEGQTGITSYSVKTSSVTTLRSNKANALLTKETTVTLQASYGLISVFIPSGALGGTTWITIEPKADFMPPLSAVSVLKPTGIGLEITRFPPVLILNPVAITLPYRLSDLPAGIDRSRLILALYDEAGGVWVPLPSVSDMAGNKVTAQTWHLSTFQLMEAAPAASLGAVRIYPNPYTPSSVADVMHFNNMPPYAKVKIYTFLGELVKEFSADVNGMAYWDGKNSSGQKAASGVYLALLKTSDKRSSRTVKVVIER